MADGQEPSAEEVSDVLAEAHRPARIVEGIPALALLMAMPTLRAPVPRRQTRCQWALTCMRIFPRWYCTIDLDIFFKMGWAAWFARLVGTSQGRRGERI
jgi:hypothetical protein